VNGRRTARRQSHRLQEGVRKRGGGEGVGKEGSLERDRKSIQIERELEREIEREGEGREGGRKKKKKNHPFVRRDSPT